MCICDVCAPIRIGLEFFRMNYFFFSSIIMNNEIIIKKKKQTCVECMPAVWDARSSHLACLCILCIYLLFLSLFFFVFLILHSFVVSLNCCAIISSCVCVYKLHVNYVKTQIESEKVGARERTLDYTKQMKIMHDFNGSHRRGIFPLLLLHLRTVPIRVMVAVFVFYLEHSYMFSCSLPISRYYHNSHITFLCIRLCGTSQNLHEHDHHRSIEPSNKRSYRIIVHEAAVLLYCWGRAHVYKNSYLCLLFPRISTTENAPFSRPINN